MLGEVSHVREDEVHIKGYIRQNFLNAKRLVHLTGKPVLSWRIKRIEFCSDPCPMKLSEREKDKVLSTSRAQSIVSSRNSSRRSSRKGSFDEMKDVEEVKDSDTKIKCVQKAGTAGDDARDDDRIENNPGAFAAEQTWPTETEIKSAQRKLSGQDEMVEMDTGDVPNIGGFNIEKKPEADLAGLFDKLKIAVVGKENEEASDSEISSHEEDELDGESEGVDAADDPNLQSMRH